MTKHSALNQIISGSVEEFYVRNYAKLGSTGLGF
jgi:hypothetical protein